MSSSPVQHSARQHVAGVISEARALRRDAKHRFDLLRPRLEEMIQDHQLRDSLGSYPEYTSLWYALFDLHNELFALNARIEKLTLPFLPESNVEALVMDMRSTMLFAMLEEYYGWEEVMAREAQDLEYFRAVPVALELGDYVRADELLAEVRALVSELDAKADQVAQLRARCDALLAD